MKKVFGYLMLTKPEAEQLLAYINYRDWNGWYSGNKQHFETRHKKLKKYLENMLCLNLKQGEEPNKCS